MDEFKLLQDIKTADELVMKATVAQTLGFVHDVVCHKNISQDSYKIEVKVNDWSWRPEFKKMSWYATSEVENEDKEGCVTADEFKATMEALIEQWRQEHNAKLNIISFSEPCQQ